MFKEAFTRAQNCEKCQRFTGRKRNAIFPLKPIQAKEPFQQWGLDFIGVINPNSSTRHKFILTTIDYFTRWAEAEAMKEESQKIILKFIKS